MIVEPSPKTEPALDLGDESAPPRCLALWRELALGFGYWLAFLLILQPGNIYQAARAGIDLSFGLELLRIGGASLLGAAATPVLLALTRRFPVEDLEDWRHAGVHAFSIVALTVILIAVAQVLAVWVLAGRDPRLKTPIDQQLVANAPLLFFCMAAFVAVAHAVAFLRSAEHRRRLLSHAKERVRRADDDASPGTRPSTVAVKARGRTLLVPVADIEWIETQGNYLALHVGSSVHLVRATLARFEASLDPLRFVRVHRTKIVATNQVRLIAPLSNGDAELHLQDGTRLRLSRTYRASVEAKLA